MLVVMLRAVILYLFITFCLRLMGKRQLGDLQPSELVITILISNIASLPLEDGNIPMILGIIPIFILAAFEIVFSCISLRSKRFRSFISGSPVVIIHEGVIDQKQMKRLRYSIDDLMLSLRQYGIFDVREVEYAVVETTGHVSILQKFHAQPVTPKILQIEGSTDPPPLVTISDGKIIENALPLCGIDRSWIEATLQSNKCCVEDVFLMTCDTKKNHYIVKRQQ